MSKAIILYSYSNTMNCILIPGALILLPVMFYIQLPFPMDSLYADPDRKVIIYATLICPISERISYSADCNQLETSMVGLWCFGLILWMGSNILPSSYCKLFLCLLLYLLKKIYGVLFASLWNFNIWQAKVLSRFGALWKAAKNYTIKATPDDRSGVLQQVWSFLCSIWRSCIRVADILVMDLVKIQLFWNDLLLFSSLLF